MEIIIIILLIVIIAQLTNLTKNSSSGGALPITSSRVPSVFIDTSALMDGRIVTAAQTGFIPNNLVVPKSVVAELQLLADQADNEKRARARRGLDAIAELQGLKNVSVEVFEDGPLGDGGVDARLVELARQHNGSICTIDFNLNKVAKVHDVYVLNINELAQSIRMAFLPGEVISLNLAQKGQDAHQAVGYLADGTMVVVEKAARSIGQTVEIEFIRSLQTAAGRMMFAKLAKTAEPQASDKQKPSKQAVKKPAKGRAKTSGEDSLMELVNKQ